MYVPLGSVLTYQAKGISTTSDYTTASDAESAIASLIAASSIDVVDYNLTVPSIGAEIANNTGGIFSYDFQMTLKLKTRVTDYQAETDVQSIADSAVYAILGKMPTSVIVNVTPPSGVTTSTGPTQAPIAGSVVGTSTTDASGNSTSSSPSFWDSLTTFLKGAGVGGFLGIGLALVAVVLIVSLATSKKIIPGA